MRALIIALMLLMPVTAMAQSDLWFVRHAEKAEGKDPALTDMGKSRARMFAHMFAAQGVTRVFSTHTQRTMQTAMPTVTAVEGGLEFYDPSQIPELAVSLCESGDKILIVGHSNTTPAFVNAILGEDAFPAHDEADYDTAFHVSCGGDATQVEIISFSAREILNKKPD